MSATAERGYRIGEVAEQLGITTRTIRYYEEVGLLGRAPGREKGEHRLYSEGDVTRLRELIRLRDLLGLSLEELLDLAETQEARAELRDRWESGPSDAERLRIAERAIPLVERQLALVRSRQERLEEFAQQLAEKLKSLEAHRRKLRRR
ncbi:MAG TPA: MerR family transcriptional regulator [Gaiellaceae bacterium]|jgi:DNA-binding transcriptional MerR regulator